MLYDSFKLKFKNMPLMCTEESCDVGYHNHTEFEILLFNEGSPEVAVGDKTYNPKKGDFIFINQLEMHSVNIKEAPYLLKCICFDPSIIHDKKVFDTLKSETVYITNYIDSHLFDTSYIEKLFYSIEKAYEMSGEWSDSEISLYVTEMFIYLFKNNFLLKKDSYEKTSAFCSEVLEYISKHFSEDITSAEVSRTLNYSQGYFCRRFRRDFGQSFSDYLTMYRVSMSKILLEDEACTVAKAAYKCGFNSADYFSKCFKKTVGTLPSEYKRKKRGV